MTYIPIFAPIIASQHRSRKSRTAGKMMLFIMGILVILGAFLFRMNLTGTLASLSFEPTIMVLILIIMGIVIVSTMVYKAEMNSNESENTHQPMEIREVPHFNHSSYPQKSNVIFNCPACQNSLDEMALQGLLENKIIYCQFCGEKIHR